DGSAPAMDDAERTAVIAQLAALATATAAADDGAAVDLNADDPNGEDLGALAESMATLRDVPGVERAGDDSLTYSDTVAGTLVLADHGGPHAEGNVGVHDDGLEQAARASGSSAADERASSDAKEDDDVGESFDYRPLRVKSAPRTPTTIAMATTSRTP